MPNIAKILKEEIARIARKEARSAVAPVRKSVPQIKRSVADLKRRMAAAEKMAKLLQRALAQLQAAAPAPAPAEAGRTRLTAKGIRSLRRKLKLSQNKFATLVGVTPQAVYIWETKQGSLKLRTNTKAALLAARSITATEAAARLAKSKGKAKATKPARKRGKRK
jgi:DNA-binding transcriptional regulator YiaG